MKALRNREIGFPISSMLPGYFDEKKDFVLIQKMHVKEYDEK